MPEPNVTFLGLKITHFLMMRVFEHSIQSQLKKISFRKALAIAFIFLGSYA